MGTRVPNRFKIATHLKRKILVVGCLTTSIVGCGGDTPSEPLNTKSAVVASKNAGSSDVSTKPTKTIAVPIDTPRKDKQTKSHPLPKLDSALRRDVITAMADVGAVMLDAEGMVISVHQGLDLSNAGLARLEGFASLRSLDLSRSRVTDSGLVSLSRLGNIRWLNLSETRIGDAGIVHVAKLPDLEELVLRQTPVTDAGLSHLRQLKKLRVLVLSDTVVSDTGLRHISELDQLEVLGLFQTKVTDAGLSHLSGAGKLSELSLSQTNVTDKGVAALAEMQLDNLKTLYLAGTKITDSGMSSLVRLKQLAKLDISECPGITDAAVEPLMACKALEELTVRGTQMSEKGLQALSSALPNCLIEF